MVYTCFLTTFLAPFLFRGSSMCVCVCACVCVCVGACACVCVRRSSPQDPDTSHLFWTLLSNIIPGLKHWETMVPLLQDLGRQYQRQGVGIHHFSIVENILCTAVAQTLGTRPCSPLLRSAARVWAGLLLTSRHHWGGGPTPPPPHQGGP